MSLWSRLTGRRSRKSVRDERDAEGWQPGDLARCVQKQWFSPFGPLRCSSNPKEGQLIRVVGVEEQKVGNTRYTFLTFTEFVGIFQSQGFVKVRPDHSAADQEFTELVRQFDRRKVPAA